ncbi:unnamed protein product [Acanthosepion pharaonis]|uniref:Uncharacterized protein n=1 Tax=Acanthosepion pharaonis TaxID=158019 RepID=A0A812D5T2_ACAPH|nr:unnamed protein product [Sepia pharaonis]
MDGIRVLARPYLKGTDAAPDEGTGGPHLQSVAHGGASCSAPPSSPASTTAKSPAARRRARRSRAMTARPIARCGRRDPPRADWVLVTGFQRMAWGSRSNRHRTGRPLSGPDGASRTLIHGAWADAHPSCRSVYPRTSSGGAGEGRRHARRGAGAARTSGGRGLSVAQGAKRRASDTTSPSCHNAAAT